MTSDSFMLLFDAIFLFYGVYTIYSAMKMKKTGQPSNLIINDTELIGARDAAGFCQAIYKPFIGFGIFAMFYGFVGLLNDMAIINIPLLNVIAILLFLVFCGWFFTKMRKLKKEYLR